MFDYIVCFYFGKRRVKTTNSLLLLDRYFFVKKHLDFIKNNETVLNDINNVIFVINDSNDEDLESVKNIKNEYPFSDKIIIIGRDNSNYSYGGWNESLIHQINLNTPSSHAFLCEDDYVPCDENFHKKFIEFFNPDIIYVCQLYINNHAAISNGFIDYNKIKKYYKDNKKLFVLYNNNDYRGAEINQIKFLNNFKNFKCIDITDKYHSKFLKFDNSVVTYGNETGKELIKPIFE